MLSKLQTEAAIQSEIEKIREIRIKQLRSIRRITTGWDHIDVRDDRTRQLILNANSSLNPRAMLDFEDDAFVNGILDLTFIGDYRVPRPIDERKHCKCRHPQSCRNKLKCPPLKKDWEPLEIKILDTRPEEDNEMEKSELETETGKQKLAVECDQEDFQEKLPITLEMKAPEGYDEEFAKRLMKPFGTPEAQKYVEMVARSCQKMEVVDELVEEGALEKNGTAKRRKLSQPNSSKNEENFSELRMMNFFDNLRQLSAITDAVSAKMNYGERPDGSENDTDEVAKSEAIPDHPFEIIEAIELFVRKLETRAGKIIELNEVTSMTPDEVLFIGALRNKCILKPEEVNVVDKLAMEFMEIRIKELEKKEQPTDHIRRLYYRFLLNKYNSLLGPIIQFLAMAGRNRIRDVEWRFFVVVANTKNDK